MFQQNSSKTCDVPKHTTTHSLHYLTLGEDMSWYKANRAKVTICEKKTTLMLSVNLKMLLAIHNE